VSESESSAFLAEHITHAYSSVVVLRDVSFELRRGRVAGLVGENGSGKSTLLKIMTGALGPSRGRLLLDGEEVAFSSPADAQRAGLAVVHQDYNLFNDLTVAENVYGVAHALPRRTWSRRVDRRRLSQLVEALLADLGIPVPTGALVRSLDAVERKFVEIARAMVVRPRFLILDEPTASLEPAAAERVLELIDRLREQGTGIAVVSHRLHEITSVSDQVTVLRDGQRIALAPAGTSEHELARLVGGPQVERARAREDRPAPDVAGGAPVLRLEGVRVTPAAPPIDLEVRAGEIVGLTGLLGSGAARLLAMAGGSVPLAGRARVDGVPARIGSPIAARKLGIGFIPEDRKGAGVVPEQSVAANIALASLERTSRGPLLDRRAIDAQARRYRDELGIRLPSIHAPVRSLSGGNQQKVLLARWLASGARLLVIDEPTHGVDVGGKAQIHELLRRFADDGGAVLVASTDVGEVLDLCDRVGVLRHGELVSLSATAELTHSDLTLLGLKEAA
jgi:ABC-type sugar transport system ATPase subunit